MVSFYFGYQLLDCYSTEKKCEKSILPKSLRTRPNKKAEKVQIASLYLYLHTRVQITTSSRDVTIHSTDDSISLNVDF